MADEERQPLDPKERSRRERWRERRAKAEGRKRCPRCYQFLPDTRLCTATSKSTGEGCRHPAISGMTVCRFHGAGGSPKTTNFRYATAIDTNPELREAYLAVIDSKPDEFDVGDELVLYRTRLLAAVKQGDIDIKVLNEIQKDLVRAVQKNAELKIKMEGLVQKKDVEVLLRAAVRSIVKFVPDNLKGHCFEELAQILGGASGGNVINAEAVSVPALEAGD